MYVCVCVCVMGILSTATHVIMSERNQTPFFKSSFLPSPDSVLSSAAYLSILYPPADYPSHRRLSPVACRLSPVDRTTYVAPSRRHRPSSRRCAIYLDKLFGLHDPTLLILGFSLLPIGSLFESFSKIPLYHFQLFVAI
ncbi:hypothetical protein F4780DRAFT_246503 [Xylariomycetidae sp. FL0641]|nr:hypothetical protein F4780DRAFT_246503 [Xylariomycetidae sp. FL0641]